MRPSLTTVLTTPLRAVQLVLRAAEDLNAVAERARREPDPIEEIRERIDLVQRELATLIASAQDVNARGHEIVDGGADLTDTAKRLDAKLAVLLGEMPELLDELGTVADTVEPLQGAAEGVGRLTKRLRSRN